MRTSIRTHRVFAGTAILAMVGAAADPALATNGYFANGYGAGSKGMAGAGVAVPSGVLSLAQNPAFGNKVGNSAGFCVTVFSPDRGFDIEPGGPLVAGKETSSNDYFYIPCGGANWSLNDRSSLGFVIYGNGGMNTEYDTNIFSNFAPPGVATTPLGVNLEQVFIGLNYSYELNDQITLGFAPIYALQRFSATGLEPFDNAMFSTNPGNVTNNGDSWSRGWGYHLGLLYEPNAEWDIGISYRSRIWMSEFDRYSGLFAEQGDFDVPPTFSIGAGYTPAADPRFTITAEYQRIYYSQIPAIANSSAVIDTQFGASDGPGFGWEDMDVFRVGAVYRQNDQWTFRGGVSYATQFIDNDEVLLNTLAPGTIQWHASVGATYKLNENWSLHGAYTHAFESKVSGRNETSAFGLDLQDIDLRMSQNEIVFGASYDW
ncbi:OmpP1/FadL family transporter [Tropicimonas sediminicola]|uniref:Long-chain fatty acid transport protein n=1 Tax=Tropicimonas sediminicola TaxID=1031541 RepID=A0A239LH43_9RHOB|nr:outer membrane protein transport protein [Tropicimonas sediminicola]SNT29936.1 long-chain fatty acid transport protein [Tropicimonas sediminicola]